MKDGLRTLNVIGGGAAGFFCAVTAARLNPNLKVTIIEKTNKLLGKVRISGGGRCNVTHACFEIDEMIKAYPRGKNFVKKTFHQFFTTDTIRWFEERDVKLIAENDGRMFPVSNTSQTIIDCLLREANRHGVGIMLGAEVKKICREGDRFRISMQDSRQMTPDYICIASGGYPKSSQFEWIRELGHTIEAPVPSLFTFNSPHHPIVQLMGVSVENASIKISSSVLKESGPVLITHWGLSGPAVLRLSAWGARHLYELNYDFSTLINWLPLFHENSLREFLQKFRNTNGSAKIVSRNPFGLPQRLWEFLLGQSQVDLQLKWNELPAQHLHKLVSSLCAYEMKIKGKTTYKEEFVTSGGIRLSEIDANTMQSKKVANLFFAGENMDVDAVTGGFNFQHAWTTGWIAGNSIAKL